MRYSDKMRSERASRELKKSGSSYALLILRFLGISLCIGILQVQTCGIFAGTHAETDKKRWKPLRTKIDILLLRNQPHHVIEGTGAAGMLLGETEVELRKRYGGPAYRDHASPETLYYTDEKFNAAFVLRNGRIVEIHLEIEKHKPPSLEWFTALGLYEGELKKFTPEEAASYLQRFYRTKRLRQVGNSVEVFSRGIRFRFRGKSVIFVDVMAPQPYDAE